MEGGWVLLFSGIGGLMSDIVKVRGCFRNAFKDTELMYKNSRYVYITFYITLYIHKVI